MRVKVCGITNVADAVAAARCGADYIGLIRAASARQVSLETARDIVGTVGADPSMPVLVFRDAPVAEIAAAVEFTGAHWVQLHGRESPEFISGLKSHVPNLHVVRAWEVSGPASGEGLRAHLEQLAALRLTPDFVLLDVPKNRAHPGFECLVAVSQQGATAAGMPPIWCAGGLTPDNVEAAVAGGCYAGVDVARGVEARPGIKNRDALRRFIETARRLPERGGASAGSIPQ